MQGLPRKSWRKDRSMFASTSRRRLAYQAKTTEQPQPTVSSTDASKQMSAMMRELGV